MTEKVPKINPEKSKLFKKIKDLHREIKSLRDENVRKVKRSELTVLINNYNKM
jgi:hypothetical protein